MPKNAKDVLWRDLRDGLEFHAVHVRQLADATITAAAELANATGAAGCFVWPPQAGADGLVNSVEPDDENRVLDLTNVAVLTHGGYIATIPPPKKSFAVPRTGDERFLNLYVSDYETGTGATEARWEKQPAKNHRSVALAEWSHSERKFKLLPLPQALGAMHQSALAFADVQAIAEKLRNKLLTAGQTEFQRVGLTRAQSAELAPFLQQLERVRFTGQRCSTSHVMTDLRAIASELLGWFQFLRAKADVRSSRTAQFDGIGRAALAGLGAEGLPEYFSPLPSAPSTGQDLLAWLQSLVRSLEGFHRVISGETDEDPLTPFETFEPDPWPEGIGYKYSLRSRGHEVTLRCEVTAQEEPEMMWGLGPAEYLPSLTPALLSCIEPGRYQVQLGPMPAQDTDAVVVILDTTSAALRTYALNQ